MTVAGSDESKTIRARLLEECNKDWLEHLTNPAFKRATEGGQSKYLYVFQVAYMAGASGGVRLVKELEKGA